MGPKRRFGMIVDSILSLGIVIASLGLLIYMFANNLFSIGLFLALCIFLYIGVRNLIGEKMKAGND